MTLQSNISCGHTIKTHFCFFIVLILVIFLLEIVNTTNVPMWLRALIFIIVLRSHLRKNQSLYFLRFVTS